MVETDMAKTETKFLDQSDHKAARCQTLSMSTKDTTKLVRNTDSPDLAELIQTCPIDGARLRPQKCKLVCACGYYLSCSDYY